MIPLHIQNHFRSNPSASLVPMGPSVTIRSSAFGFGLRVCPGRHFVDSSLFFSVSCILSVFHVGPPKDELGNEIPVASKDSGTNSRYG